MTIAKEKTMNIFKVSNKILKLNFSATLTLEKKYYHPIKANGLTPASHVQLQ